MSFILSCFIERRIAFSPLLWHFCRNQGRIQHLNEYLSHKEFTQTGTAVRVWGGIMTEWFNHLAKILYIEEKVYLLLSFSSPLLCIFLLRPFSTAVPLKRLLILITKLPVFEKWWLCEEVPIWVQYGYEIWAYTEIWSDPISGKQKKICKSRYMEDLYGSCVESWETIGALGIWVTK